MRLGTSFVTWVVMLAGCAIVAGACGPRRRFAGAKRIPDIAQKDGSTCEWEFVGYVRDWPSDAQFLRVDLALGLRDGCIVESADLGLNWSVVGCIPASYRQGHHSQHRGFQAVSDKQWWTLVDRDHLLETSDGGATWVGDSIPDGDNHSGVILRGFHFVDARTGFAVGERLSYGDGTHAGVAFRTRNGGDTWERLRLPVPEFDNWRLNAVGGDPSGKVWLVGDVLLASRDRGETWYAPTVVGGDVEDYGNDDIAFGPNGTAWITRTPSENLLVSTDSGDRWEVRELAPPIGPIAATDLSFVSPTDAFLAYRVLYRSRDGGRTWQAALEPPDRDGFFAVYYLESERLSIAVSSHLAVCKWNQR